MTEQPDAGLEPAPDVSGFVHPDGWIHLAREDIGGSTRIPADYDVLVWHEARGWVVVDPPDPAVIEAPVIHTGPQPPPTDEWVEMVHPVTNGSQRIPNDPAAIDGARDAGWVTATEAAAEEVEAVAAEVSDLTVAEVLAAVDGDRTKAEAALSAERDGKNRSSLISALDAIVSAPETEFHVEMPTTTEQES